MSFRTVNPRFPDFELLLGAVRFVAMFASFLKKPMAVVTATGRPTRLPFTQEVFDGICPEIAG